MLDQRAFPERRSAGRMLQPEANGRKIGTASQDRLRTSPPLVVPALPRHGDGEGVPLPLRHGGVPGHVLRVGDVGRRVVHVGLHERLGDLGPHRLLGHGQRRRGDRHRRGDRDADRLHDGVGGDDGVRHHLRRGVFRHQHERPRLCLDHGDDLGRRAGHGDDLRDERRDDRQLDVGARLVLGVRQGQRHRLVDQALRHLSKRTEGGSATRGDGGRWKQCGQINESDCGKNRTKY